MPLTTRIERSNSVRDGISLSTSPSLTWLHRAQPSSPTQGRRSPINHVNDLIKCLEELVRDLDVQLNDGIYLTPRMLGYLSSEENSEDIEHGGSTCAD